MMNLAEIYDMFEDGAKSSGPQAGQYAIAYALLVLAGEIQSIGPAMDGAADTLGKGPLAGALSRIAN
jgi:hypothetical protein